MLLNLIQISFMKRLSNMDSDEEKWESPAPNHLLDMYDDSRWLYYAQVACHLL